MKIRYFTSQLQKMKKTATQKSIPAQKPTAMTRHATQPSIVSPRGQMQRKLNPSPTSNRNISPPRRNASPPRRNISPPKRNISPPGAAANRNAGAKYQPKPLQSKAPTLGVKSKKKSSIPVYHFSPAELEKLRAGFQEIDLDGNGRLDKFEMNTFLQKNGLDITFTDLEYQLFSHDGETLDFDEFKNYMSVTSQMETNPRVYYKCLFDFIDKDGSGGIDQNELMEFCRLVKNPITATEAKKTIEDLDDTHTGTINFNELCKYLGC